ARSTTRYTTAPTPSTARSSAPGTSSTCARAMATSSTPPSRPSTPSAISPSGVTAIARMPSATTPWPRRCRRSPASLTQPCPPLSTATAPMQTSAVGLLVEEVDHQVGLGGPPRPGRARHQPEVGGELAALVRAVQRHGIDLARVLELLDLAAE